MRYLHTMIRVRDLDVALDFFVNKLWFDYTAVTGVAATALIMLMPYLIGMLPPQS